MGLLSDLDTRIALRRAMFEHGVEDHKQLAHAGCETYNAARRELLTESLIGLPEEITEFRAEMYQRTERIQGHLNNLRGYDVLSIRSACRRSATAGRR